jgi:hypothetical protein
VFLVLGLKLKLTLEDRISSSVWSPQFGGTTLVSWLSLGVCLSRFPARLGFVGLFFLRLRARRGPMLG